MRIKEGKYLVFEGVVKCGKTTQSRLLVRFLQEKLPGTEVIWTREPGGSEIADAIRKVVQGTDFAEQMDPVCEQYLYGASRAQTLRQVVRPVVLRGGIVVADRSFFSSMAFQGAGRRMGVDRVLEINRPAVGEMWPDRVLFIDTDLAVCMERRDDSEGDKFERLGFDFFERVRSGYLDAVCRYGSIARVIDGNGSVEAVAERVRSSVIEFLHETKLLG